MRYTYLIATKQQHKHPIEIDPFTLRLYDLY